LTILIRFAFRNYHGALKSCNTTSFFTELFLVQKAQFQEDWINLIISHKQNQSVLQNWVRQSVKRIVILTMYHVSEFQKILDSNYTRIGLSIYVKFSLGKWLATRQKIIQNRSQKTQNHASSFRVRDQKCYHRISVLLQFETSALPSNINGIHIIIVCSPTSVCNILNLANWFFHCM